LFKPFKPRLAHKADYRTVHKEMYKKGDYVAEYKLDGERVVLHFRRGDGAGGSARAEWWTRNCHNFTHQYGEALAPVLAECLSPELRETFGVVATQGVIVTGVLQGGPAARAGVAPGDVIVAIAGTAVDDVSQLLAQVAALKPGVPAQFSVQRKKQTLQLPITPGLRPRPQRSIH
jgi:hypothetical protein